MYVNEINELLASIKQRLDLVQEVDIEREVLRIQRFQTLLLYVDEAYKNLRQQVDASFIDIRKEIETVMFDQKNHADMMGAQQPPVDEPSASVLLTNEAVK